MGGRPRALDDTKRREICALISTGCGLGAAADYVGCNPITIRREALRNPEFHDELRKARMAAQVLPLQAMRKAANTNWRAAAWFLERTQPHTFGARHPSLMTADEVAAAIQIVFDMIDNEVSNPDDARRVRESLRNVAKHFEAQRHAIRAPIPDVRSRRDRDKKLRDRLATGRRKAFRHRAESNASRDDPGGLPPSEPTSSAGSDSP